MYNCKQKSVKRKKKDFPESLSDVWEEERVGGRRRCSLEGRPRADSG